MREVPGSNPGRALSFYCKALRRTGVKCLIFQLAISGRDSSVGRALDEDLKVPGSIPGRGNFARKSLNKSEWEEENVGPGEIRTHDLLFTRQAL